MKEYLICLIRYFSDILLIFQTSKDIQHKVLQKTVFYRPVRFDEPDAGVFLLLQQTITCSKSTIETLEKGVKYVQN